MKKYYIISLLFAAVLAVSIISPRVFTQSYRLTKVGYIDLERVIKEITGNQELNEKLKERLEQYKSQDNQRSKNHHQASQQNDDRHVQIFCRWHTLVSPNLNKCSPDSHSRLFWPTDNRTVFSESSEFLFCSLPAKKLTKP